MQHYTRNPCPRCDRAVEPLAARAQAGAGGKPASAVASFGSSYCGSTNLPLKQALYALISP